MKFLLVLKLKERPPIPTEKFLEMVVKEWETALQFRKEGKADINYGLAGQKGAMAIFNAESGAELDADLMKLPLYGWLDIEIYPLMTAEEVLTRTKKFLEAVKARK
ncbi:MAG: muconolactone Delta-isomerase family protein [Promethearchaeota archaeon]